MAPKKIMAKQPFVYIILDEAYTSPGEYDAAVDGKQVKIFHVHTDLGKANDDADAHFEMNFPQVNDLARREISNHDETLSIRFENKSGYTSTRVIKMNLFSGTINPLDAPKKAASKKKPATTKKRVTDSDDEEGGDYDDDKYDKVTSAVISKSAATAGTKRKASVYDMEDDDDEDDEVSSPLQLADVENHFAPAGETDCLKGYSFFVTGTLDPWTRDQVDALIKEFGGTISSKIKHDLDFIVMGTKPGPAKLIEMRLPENANIEEINQKGLYDLIATSRGKGLMKTKEHVTNVCKAAKKAPKKRAKKT